MMRCIIFGIFLLCLFSCKNKENKVDYEQSNKLFSGTISLIQEYTDSLRMAKDSTEVFRIVENFNDRLTRLNYTVDPETDYLLTQEENDSIIFLSNNFIKEKNLILSGFKHKPVLTDSIE